MKDSPRTNLLVSLLIFFFAALAVFFSSRGPALAGFGVAASANSRMAVKNAAPAARPAAADLQQRQIASAAVGEEQDLLLFKARAIDTRFPASALRSADADVAAEALVIIQFAGPLREAWLAAVEASGAQLVHYVPNNGYLVWADAAARRELDRMAAAGEILRYSAPYDAALKQDPALSAAALSADLLDVQVMMLRHADAAQSEAQLRARAAEQLSPWSPLLTYQTALLRVSRSAVAGIAALPDVVWIEAPETPRLTDEVQTQILAGSLNAARTGPAAPGYLPWLKERGFSEDPQDYPIIDITDDGIGSGVAETAAGDRTLRAGGDPTGESRVSYIANCTSAADGSGADGHGHINASIAAGFDTRSGSPYRDSKGYQRGLGVNPFGRVAGTRVFNGPTFDTSGCDRSYTTVVARSYNAGARILSNSWGCAGCTYNDASLAYDAAVRDADPFTPGNQEMLILFSAGNEGVYDPGAPTDYKVGSPANGKNVLTVGATENVRPTWKDGCRYGPSDADNLQDIASYSSRGPAPGGLVKPDLVAPGTHVMGTASTTPLYNGSAICDAYQPGGQTIFAASTGTSHSVPAVAGFASLASYWLTEKEGIPSPSPALLKAFLIASSHYLIGVGANDDLPSYSQGFGMPSMARAFGDNERVVLDQAQTPLLFETGQSWSLRARAADNSLPVRIVMVFTDVPGLPAANGPMNNDLDLVVETAADRFLGNVMDGPWSSPGGERDAANTVEAVFLPAGEGASLAISVNAERIAGDGVPGNGQARDQDFALFCDNCRIEIIDYDYHSFLPGIGAR